MADSTIPQMAEKPHSENVERVNSKTEQGSSSNNSDQDVTSPTSTSTPDDGPAERISASTIMAIFVNALPSLSPKPKRKKKKRKDRTLD